MCATGKSKLIRTSAGNNHKNNNNNSETDSSLPPHVVVLDDDHDDDGIGYGRDQEQRDVHADQQYAPGFGEPHLRGRELGDQLLDDRRLAHAARVLRPQAVVAFAGRRVVEHPRVRSGRPMSSTGNGGKK